MDLEESQYVQNMSRNQYSNENLESRLMMVFVLVVVFLIIFYYFMPSMKSYFLDEHLKVDSSNYNQKSLYSGKSSYFIEMPEPKYDTDASSYQKKSMYAGKSSY
jgi:hypothetical protein